MYNLVTSQSLLTTGEKGHAQYVDPPVIPGHEFFGEVVKLGKGTYITSEIVMHHMYSR